jgi:uncharacterized membrane protein
MPQGSWVAIHTNGERQEPAIRSVSLLDLREALDAGFDDFKAAPTQMIALGIIYPLVGIAAARHAAGAGLLPMIYPLVAGLSLLGPIAALGLYEISRRRETGADVSWLDAFAVLRSRSLLAVAELGAILFAVFVAWLFTAQTVYALTVGPGLPEAPLAFLTTIMTTPGGWALVVAGNAIGLLFAAFVLAISVVSFPMMLDRHVGALVAIRTSLRVVRRNPGTMAAWGFLVAMALATASLPAFVGLAIVVPILGHATWHLYRRAVRPERHGGGSR